MKILYGVVGEGMGHATRSRVVIRHLLDEGHQVKVIVSGRAHDFMKKHFPDVEEITGLKFIYEDSAVQRGRTFKNFLKELPLWGGWARNFEVMSRIAEDFDPDCVISDFESLAYLYGMRNEIPVLSIDNIQIINRCELDIEIPEGERTNFAIAKGIVKAKLPGCHHYLITTFFFPPVRKERTTLFPPLLRPEILDAKAAARMGEHILVYQTSETMTRLLPTLGEMPHRFVVYGLNRDEDHGNVVLKSFSEAGFIEDLASAKAVVTNGGFTLISEAVYLGKPILAIPIGKQFEQLLNALYVEKLGYGAWAESLSGAAIEAFLDRHADYAAAVSRHQQDGNTAILAALDQHLRDIQSARPTGAGD